MKTEHQYILRELYAAGGVEKKDILFIISNGLHPRSKESDAKAILVMNYSTSSWHTGQIISHDSEDQGAHGIPRNHSTEVTRYT